MKVQVLRKTGDAIVFVLDGATPAFANALRRIMVSEVPTMAVEYVDFNQNSSVLFDELVAHRIGMIPMTFDSGKMVRKEDCKCGGKGCPVCEAVLVVEKKGPAIVYSGDLKTSNKDVKPVSPDFPIAELLDNQEMKFEAKAEVGVGKDHAKWQAAIASYQYFPEVETGDCKPEDLKKAVSLCPKGVLAVKGKTLEIKDPAGCDLCLKCEQVGDCVKIKANPGKFVFRVESVSGLKNAEIVEKAAAILEAKAEEFKKNAGKL